MLLFAGEVSVQRGDQQTRERIACPLQTCRKITDFPLAGEEYEQRLAMLLDVGEERRLDAVIALEDDAQVGKALASLRALREAGLSAELVASGSPRKRFDKAAKIPAHALVSVGTRDDAPHINVRGDSERAKAVGARTSPPEEG